MRWDARSLRTAVIWTIIAGAFLVSAVAVVLESGIFTPRLIRELNERLAASDLEIHLESMNLRPWSGLTIYGVELSTSAPPDSLPEPSAPPVQNRTTLAAVGQLEVGYRFFGLLFGQPQIDRLRVVRPDVNLEELLRWDARTSGEDAAAPFADSADEAPGVRVDQLEIVEGRLRMGDLDLSNLHLVGGVDGDDGRWDLEVDIARGRLRTPRLDEQLELTGSVALHDGTVDVDALHLGMAGGRVSLEGTFGDPESAQSELWATGYGIPLESVAGWLDTSHPLLTGPLEFRMVISGAPLDLGVAGDLSVVASDSTERRVRFSAHRQESGLTIDSLHLTVNESRLDLHGQIVFGERPHAHGMAVFESLDPALVLAEPDLEGVEDLRGFLRFEGSGRSRDTFEGAAELELEQAVLFGFSVDAASADLTMERGSLVLTQMRATRGRSEVTGFGSLDPENRLVAELRGSIVDLSDIGAVTESSTAPFDGRADIDVRLDGPVKAPRLSAVLAFENAQVVGASVRTLSVELSSAALGADSDLEITAVGQDVGYGGRVLPRMNASGSWRSGALRVTDLHLESDRRGELQLTGDLELSGAGNLSGRVTTLAMRSSSGGVEWRNEGPIRMEKTAESLTFSGLDLRSGTGRVFGDVSVHESGEAFVRAHGSQVDLSLFGPFVLTPKPLSGLLDFDVNAIVSSEKLAGDATVDLRAGSYGEDSLERLEGTIRVEDALVVVDGVTLRSTFATADASGTIALSEGSFRSALADSAARRALVRNLVFDQVSVELDAPDLEPILGLVPQIRSPAGSGSVSVTIDGPANSLDVAFRAAIGDGRLGTEPLESLSAAGAFRDGVFTIDECRIASGSGTMTVHGTLPLEWNLEELKPRVPDDAEANLQFDAVQFPVRALAVVSSIFEMMRGDLNARGALRGSRGNHYLDGSFDAGNARLDIPTFTDPFVNGTVRGTLDRRGVQIEEGLFYDGHGELVRGSGRIEMVNFSPTGMRLDIDADHYHYRGIAGIQAEVRGRVVMTGRRTSEGKLVPHFAGEVRVLRADLDERILLPPTGTDDLIVPEGVTLPEDATTEAAADTASVDAVVLADITFVADDNVWLRTREIDAELGGRLTLHMTEETIGPTGQVRTLRGTYTLLNNEFNVRRAEVQFTDPADVEAAFIDAVATTRVLEEDVTVVISGTLGNPLIQSSTDSGMSEAEIYELLALRQKRDPDEEAEGQGLVSDDLWTSYGAILASRFGRQLSSQLGFDTFDVDVEDGGVRRTVGLGKYLGSGLFLQYRRDISGEGGVNGEPVREVLETPREQLLLEIRLNDVFQLEGETGIIEDEEYLNVDLRAEWGY